METFNDSAILRKFSNCPIITAAAKLIHMWAKSLNILQPGKSGIGNSTLINLLCIAALEGNYVATQTAGNKRNLQNIKRNMRRQADDTQIAKLISKFFRMLNKIPFNEIAFNINYVGLCKREYSTSPWNNRTYIEVRSPTTEFSYNMRCSNPNVIDYFAENINEINKELDNSNILKLSMLNLNKDGSFSRPIPSWYKIANGHLLNKDKTVNLPYIIDQTKIFNRLQQDMNIPMQNIANQEQSQNQILNALKTFTESDKKAQISIGTQQPEIQPDSSSAELSTSPEFINTPDPDPALYGNLLIDDAFADANPTTPTVANVPDADTHTDEQNNDDLDEQINSITSDAIMTAMSSSADDDEFSSIPSL